MPRRDKGQRSRSCLTDGRRVIRFAPPRVSSIGNAHERSPDERPDMEESMDNVRLARSWLLLSGVILIAVGILGFFSNPLVGVDGFVATDNLHNIVHIATGLLALGLVYLMREDIGTATIVFGALYLAVFVVTLISPTLFGLFSVEVNAVDHVIHIGLAVVSLGLGFMARGRSALAAG
jgi:hypothetical protein